MLKGCFADGPFSFAGEHYTITDYDAQPKPTQRPHPPFLIGGGGRRTLTLAAREAQIVGLAPRILPNRAPDPRSVTFEGTREKIDWVREASGERFEELELNVYPSITGVSITDEPLKEAGEVAERLQERSGILVSAEELFDSPHIFVNTVDGFVEKLRRHRDELGISSIMVGGLGELDPVVDRLLGHLIVAVIESRNPRRRSSGIVSARILVYTGKGGVGKTSVAAATALLRRARLPHDRAVDRHRARSAMRSTASSARSPRRSRPNLWGAGVGRLPQHRHATGDDPGLRLEPPALARARRRAWPRR